MTDKWTKISDIDVATPDVISHPCKLLKTFFTADMELTEARQWSIALDHYEKREFESQIRVRVFFN
jgi:hypothetical protein